MLRGAPNLKVGGGQQRPLTPVFPKQARFEAGGACMHSTSLVFKERGNEKIRMRSRAEHPEKSTIFRGTEKRPPAGSRKKKMVCQKSVDTWGKNVDKKTRQASQSGLFLISSPTQRRFAVSLCTPTPLFGNLFQESVHTESLQAKARKNLSAKLSFLLRECCF